MTKIPLRMIDSVKSSNALIFFNKATRSSLMIMIDSSSILLSNRLSLIMLMPPTIMHQIGKCYMIALMDNVMAKWLNQNNRNRVNIPRKRNADHDLIQLCGPDQKASSYRVKWPSRLCQILLLYHPCPYILGFSFGQLQKIFTLHRR